MRIAFAGTPEFAVPTLRALADSPQVLVGVLTQPDRPAGRGREPKASPVKRLAQELNLPLWQPAGLAGPDVRSTLERWGAEALVVVAYGLILPPAMLALPRLGCINVHASLLPRWRGAAPIQRALLAGDADSGITIMQMEAGLDTGPILAQQRVPIEPDENAQQLQQRLAVLGAQLLLLTLEQAQAGLLRPRPQSDQGVTYAAKIDKTDAVIDWRLGADAIARQVRAFNPWPVAETRWQGRQLRIWEARVWLPPAGGAKTGARAPGTAGSGPGAAGAWQPGDILGLEHDQLRVQCGQGRLSLIKLQLPGRRIVTAREFASGQAMAGSRFG
ncbi:MAG: methionyl-tRNA formyltransferase [Steroidobacterales bacterium]